MALVGYDYSDDSEDELDDDAVTGKIPQDSSTFRKELPVPTLSAVNKAPCMVDFNTALSILGQTHPNTNAEEEEDDDDSSDSDTVDINVSFSSLSKPRHDTLCVQNLKNKSSKYEHWKKVVSVPQMKKPSTFRNEGNSSETNNKDSGLLSVLPSPSHESTRKTGVVISNTKLLPTAVKNRVTSNKEIMSKDIDAGGKSGSDSDFFNLSKIDEDPEYDSSLVDLDIVIGNTVDKVNVPKQLDIPVTDTSRDSLLSKYLRDSDVSSEETSSVDEINQSQNGMNLDEDAVLKLCGRKRKGQFPDDIQVIDIHEDNIIAETRKNLTKRLTEEVPNHPIRAGPSTLSKRKHQITYLAYQAKERELELKNQWANNRFTKRQTQSKYGF